jgi:hypothetical protein
MAFDFRQSWENIKREIEDRPVVVMGVLGTVLYGASHIMDSNTRRVNAKTQRKYQKDWEREVARRERKAERKK